MLLALILLCLLPPPFFSQCVRAHSLSCVPLIHIFNPHPTPLHSHSVSNPAFHIHSHSLNLISSFLSYISSLSYTHFIHPSFPPFLIYKHLVSIISKKR
ncbi:hypothetical protein BDZ45DRAFT_138325 [Acephala macrosclerotiorum]|nr:hypothetical protein BDZ45DRAFT_138325 [Acephala macrosclerotiorum]